MICLCSSSESRALLLNNFGVDFVQRSPEYDEEQISTTVAKDFVYTASKGKLDTAIRQFGLEMLCWNILFTSLISDVDNRKSN